MGHNICGALGIGYGRNAASKLPSEALGVPQENEFRAAATGVGELYPDAVNVLEMGGENSTYIRVGDNGNAGAILDFETNGDCAAGTGSFMDQQAGRLAGAMEEARSIFRSVPVDFSKEIMTVGVVGGILTRPQISAMS
jgi:activator of 2-hydroxyglutaryl-CoA dehydratase